MILQQKKTKYNQCILIVSYTSIIQEKLCGHRTKYIFVKNAVKKSTTNF